MSHFEKGNQHVAEEYICDGNPLFDTQPVQLPKCESVNPYMHEDLLRFFISVSQAHYEKTDALYTRIETLEKRVSSLEEKLQFTRNQLKHPVKTIGSKFIEKKKK